MLKGYHHNDTTVRVVKSQISVNTQFSETTHRSTSTVDVGLSLHNGTHQRLSRCRYYLIRGHDRSLVERKLRDRLWRKYDKAIMPNMNDSALFHVTAELILTGIQECSFQFYNDIGDGYDNLRFYITVQREILPFLVQSSLAPHVCF
ncbi:hypothetical protein BV898_18893 [Hypsibius exemplaris]|uniref:Uncharacterized protein n=1 Tax=Hypsibius exemplaris TaxID=2072580 RepID=A0A9X6NKH5_HYPEX|nr:hypothetical protein BV898_18893 [Hypsibius exemplaris]